MDELAPIPDYVEITIGSKTYKCKFDGDGLYSTEKITKYSEYHDGEDPNPEDVVDPFYFTDMRGLVHENESISFRILED